MRLLITGGGRLAQALAQTLTEEAAYQGWSAVFPDKEQLNVTDTAGAEAWIGGGAFDWVINCAAYTDVDGCESNPERAMEVNGRGVGNLALACRGVCSFMTVSTDYVFDGKGGRPLTEGDETNPVNVYGKSKLLGEELAALCEKSLVVRTSWLYYNAGADFVGSVAKRLREGQQVRAADDVFGTPTYGRDLARHLLALAEAEQYGLIHCAGHGVCSRFELARGIGQLLRVQGQVIPCKQEEIERPLIRPVYTPLENKRLQALNLDHMNHWRQGVARALGT